MNMQTPRYRHRYEWHEVPMVALPCGLIVGLLTAWETHQALGPVIAGIGTAIAVAAMWSYRIWRQ